MTDDRDHVNAPAPEDGFEHESDSPSIGFACCRCRYELRGISLDGRCPECGEPIWRTLAERVDLSAAFIDPETCRRTGRRLPAIAGVVAVASLLAAGPPVAWPWMIEAWWSGAEADAWRAAVPILWIGCGVVVLLASIGLREGIEPLAADGPPGPLERPLSTPRGLLVVGGLLALLTGAMVWVRLDAAASPIAIAATGVLLLASGLFAERLGPASRRWREGGSARQSPWLVVGTLVTALLLAFASKVFQSLEMVEAGEIAGLLAAGAVLLVVVGGIYLAVNLVWIASDLRRRRPRLERLLAERSASAS